jgi:hypothetical protein
MPNEFEILAGFLERCESEVEGRELQEPTAETQDRMRELARGKLGAEQQGELLKLLSAHPEWIAHLAGEIKALRSPSAPAA